MRITAGCTRLVILTETAAIKIAIPANPLLPFFLALRALLQGELRQKLRKHRGGLIRFTARVVTNSGISANRREIRLSKKYAGFPIAPVLASYCWGAVIVMLRGEHVRRLPHEWDARMRLPAALRITDLFEIKNAGRFGEEIRFIDYGHPTAESILPFLFGTRSAPDLSVS